MRRSERGEQAWAKWRKLVAEQGRSGQTVAAFCRERGLCGPHFFAWKKRLCAAGEGSAGGGARGRKLAQFVEVQLAPVAEASVDRGRSVVEDRRIEVRLRRGRSLWVGRGFDAKQVRELVAAVESAE